MNPSATHIRINRFGNESNRPVVNVNTKYGRLYFSVFAVKTLALDQGNFRVVQRGARWLLSKTTCLGDLAMKVHMGAYYVVSKSLVISLVNYFQTERLSFLIEGTDRKRKYYALKFFVPTSPPPRPARKTNEEFGVSRKQSKDPKITSAERILARFEQTDFAGRVKTQEILKAELILNRS